MRLSVVADDLSGGAETAGVLAATDRSGRVRRRIRVLLGGYEETADADAEVVVTDTGSRALSSDAAARCAVRALGGDGGGQAGDQPVGAGVPRFLKYDSLLRGHIAGDLAAVATRTPVVFTPAVPALDRVVRDGEVQISGVPLADSGLWALEGRAAPRRLQDLFGTGAAVGVGLAEVRGPGLTDRLAAARPGGPVICCDAVEEEDLVRVAAAAHARGAVLAGSSSLAFALSGLVLTDPPRPVPIPHLGRGPVLTLIGSGSARAAAQADELERHGGRVLRVGIAALERLELPDGDVTVVVQEPPEPALAPRIMSALAALAGQAGGRHLVLSGGETARRVLDACGVRALTPVLVPHLGAVASVTDDRRVVVTRPGGFGPDSSLVDIRDAVAHLVDASKEVTP